MAPIREPRPEHLDERRLPDPGYAGDSHPHRRAGEGQESVDQRPRIGAIGGRRALNQGDRAPERGAIAVADGPGEGLGRRSRELLEEVAGGVGNHGAGPEHRGDAEVVERGVILGRK